MSVLDILMNAARIVAVFEAWQNRINRMNFGKLSTRKKIDKISRMLEKMATDPEIDEIVDENYVD